MQLVDTVEAATRTIDAFYSSSSSPSHSSPFTAASNVLKRFAPSAGLVDVSRSHHSWLVVEQGRGERIGEGAVGSGAVSPPTTTLRDHLTRRLLSESSRRAFQLSNTPSQGSIIQFYLSECRQTVRGLLQTICALQELSTMPTCKHITISQGEDGGDDDVSHNPTTTRHSHIVSAPLYSLSKPITITSSSADTYPSALHTHNDEKDVASSEDDSHHFAHTPTTVRCFSSVITPSTISYPSYGTPIMPSPATSLLTSLVVDMHSSFQKEGGGVLGCSISSTTSLRRPFEVASSIESAPYPSPMLLWSQSQQQRHPTSTTTSTSRAKTRIRYVQTVSDDLWSVGVLALEWIIGIAELVEVGGTKTDSSLHESIFQHPNIKQRYHNIKAIGAAWRRLRGDGRTTDVSPQQTPPAVLRVAKSIAALLSSLPDVEDENDDENESDRKPSSSFRRRNNNNHHIDPLHTSQQNSAIIQTLFGVSSKENLSSFVDFILNVCLEWDGGCRWDSFRKVAWGGPSSLSSSSSSSSALVLQDALLHQQNKSSPPQQTPSHHITDTTTTPASAFRQHCLMPYLRVVKRTASAEHGHLNVLEVRQQAMYLEWARLLWGLTQSPNSPFSSTQTTTTTTTNCSHVISSIENAIQQLQEQSGSATTTSTAVPHRATLVESMEKLLLTYQHQPSNNNNKKGDEVSHVGTMGDTSLGGGDGGAVQFVRSLLGGQHIGIGSIASILSIPHPQPTSSSLQLRFHIDSIQQQQQNTLAPTTTISTAPSSGIVLLEHLQRRHIVWQERQVATNGACNVSLLDVFGVKPAPIALLPQCPVAPPPPAYLDPSTPSSPSSPNVTTTAQPSTASSTLPKVETTTIANITATTTPNALLSQIALCQQREVDKETRRRRHHGNSNSHNHNHDGDVGGFLLPTAPTAASRNELYTTTSSSQQHLDDPILGTSTTSSSAASSVGGGDAPILGDVTRENTGAALSAVSDRSVASHAASPSRRSTYSSARCKSLAAVFSEEPPARPHVLTYIRLLAMDPSVSAKEFGQHLDRIRREEQGELERAFEKFCAGPWNTQLRTKTTATSSPLLPAYFQRAILWSAGTTSSSSSPATTPNSRSLRVPIVPTTLRSICWAKLLGVPACGAGRHAVVDAPYRAINTYKPSGSDRQIAVDIPRCHQYHHLLSTVEGHRRLTRILKGWLYDVERESEFVYWQGVDSVAAVLLTTNFEDEALACASLRRVVDTYVPHYFNKITNTMDHRLVTFQHILKYVDPEVALHLEHISCRPELYTISWFLTLFAHVLPIEKVMLLWDAMLKAGHASFPVCIAVGIISQLREEIGKREFSEVVTLLSTGSVQGVLDVAVAAEDASVLFARIPPSIISPRFEGSHGTLVTSSTCSMIEVKDLVAAFNTRCDSNLRTGHNNSGDAAAGGLWASAGVFLVDLRLDEERVRGAITRSIPTTAPRRGGSMISTSSLASTTTSATRQGVVGGGSSSAGVDGLVDDFVYIDGHVTPSSSTTNLFPEHNNGDDDDDEEQGPREVILGSLHCPYDGLDGWDVDDVIAQLCQRSLMWLPSSRQPRGTTSTPVSHPELDDNDDDDDDGSNNHISQGGGMGSGSTTTSAIQAFMSTAPHVVLIAGSNPESAQAAAADLVEQGTACVSVLAGGIRNVRNGFPSLLAIVSDN